MKCKMVIKEFGRQGWKRKKKEKWRKSRKDVKEREGGRRLGRKGGVKKTENMEEDKGRQGDARKRRERK